jgi:hypothetical protein
MKRIIIMISIVLTEIYFSDFRSSRNVVSKDQPGKWHENILTVNGNDNELEKPLKHNDRREKLNYSITNDNNNVHICFKTSNNFLQLKILLSGLMVFLNNNGQKLETSGIYFPMGRKFDTKEQGIFNPFESGSLPLQTPDLPAKKEMLSKQKQYSLFGFAKSNGRYEYETQNEDDILIKVGFNEFQEFVYEASVPLKAIFHNIPFENESSSRKLAVGFFIRGFPKPDFSSGSFPPNAAGGPRGSPPGGGGSDEREETQDIQKQFQDTKIWKVIPLASFQGKKNK